VLDKAVAAGANSIYGVSLSHKDPSALLDKARPLVVANGKRKADIYATPARAKIGRLIVLTEEPSCAPTVSCPRAYTAPAFAPTPIEAGEDKLTVIVTTRFELT
jgi:uncharacterized protein YggE